MKPVFLLNIYRFYADGFRNMTLGRTLWLLILIKLFVMFFVLKLFFFPNVVKRQGDKAAQTEFVADELIGRSPAKVAN